MTAICDNFNASFHIPTEQQRMQKYGNVKWILRRRQDECLLG